MKKTSEPIVFFGSGPVAAKALELLHQDFEIAAVITKPQPAHHKELFPVLKTSHELGLKTLTVSSKAELSALFARQPVESRVGVVIDFGIIISQDVIDYFPLGIVNSHFSLLPQWRGADPITFAILSGQAETGVSLMLIVEKLDEGPLLAQRPHPIAPTATTPSLTAELIQLSHDMLMETLPGYLSGALRPYSQDLSTPPTYSRKLTKADSIIDWHKPAEQLEREIRAFIEWPKSRTRLAGKEVIITKARAEKMQQRAGSRERPRTVHITQEKEIAVQTGDGILIIERLKPSGKNEMSAEAFIR
ncbi:MAG TPA: methionyl-tRNA formyltransferase, partial [Candidatus Saccharimonadales bacterium]|nr:methionyl-tRNA formyltransferase [Candidatus Saccharimonadales bacterium]